MPDSVENCVDCHHPLAGHRAHGDPLLSFGDPMPLTTEDGRVRSGLYFSSCPACTEVLGHPFTHESPWLCLVNDRDRGKYN